MAFYSEYVFGDALIELELIGPQGSNSGIYVLSEYEDQVLDSFGRTKLGGGDMGAIQCAGPPRLNACENRASGRITKSISARQSLKTARRLPARDFCWRF